MQKVDPAAASAHLHRVRALASSSRLSEALARAEVSAMDHEGSVQSPASTSLLESDIKKLKRLHVFHVTPLSVCLPTYHRIGQANMPGAWSQIETVPAHVLGLPPGPGSGPGPGLGLGSRPGSGSQPLKLLEASAVQPRPDSRGFGPGDTLALAGYAPPIPIPTSASQEVAPPWSGERATEHDSR